MSHLEVAFAASEDFKCNFGGPSKLAIYTLMCSCMLLLAMYDLPLHGNSVDSERKEKHVDRTQ